MSPKRLSFGIAGALLSFAFTAVANAQAGSPPRYKAVWEPVNFKQDLTLYSVFFVTPDMGWAAGDAGTIIKTTDGGATWTPQLGGDAQNAARAIKDLRFVDQNTGFAVQSTGVGDHTLLRTTDGDSWSATGTVGQNRGDYIFISSTIGFQSAKHQIFATQDAGKSWKPVMPCAMSADVGGLTRNVQCEMEHFQFPTPDVGYAMGSAPGNIGVFMAKTENGGASWNLWMVLPGESGHEGHLFFTDANNGVMCLIGGKLFATSDGGKNWRGIAGTECGGKPEIRFADPEVGMTAIADKWNFTADGGRHWSSRAMNFPAHVYGFSLPRRDRGYVVGDHGMVYRYRVVPVTYTAPHAVDAPIVGTFASPLDVQVEQLLNEARAAGSGGGGGAGGSGAGGSATSGAGGSGAGGSATSAAGGGSSSGSASSASGSAAKSAASKGGNTFAKLQALLDAVGASMPQFLARYRNLNLVYEGARSSMALPGWLDTVKEGFATFRSAPDRNAAQAALSKMLSAADSLKTETRLAFQKSPSGGQP
jgi:photosystem II stability/assembly factor-like uncharacterized protein